MSEFIGSRISLISRSDIRYVGRLHDINSENHTVALEQVVSHGTEGRCGDPSKEIAGSDNVYEYIVFRGGDVKDLRIEETAPQLPQPQVPDDPAILGSATRPPPPIYSQGNAQPPNQYQQPLQPYYYPPPQAQGRYGPSPYQQGTMYGAYPPPQVQQPGLGQTSTGVPQTQQQPAQIQQQPAQQQQNQVPQQHVQAQPPQQVQRAQQQPQTPTSGSQNRAPPQAPIGPAANRQQQSQQQPMNRGPMHQGQAVQGSIAQSQPPAQVKSSEKQVSPIPAQLTVNDSPKPPTPPRNNESKPAPPTPGTQGAGKAPSGPKVHGGIVPALPLPSHSRPPRSPAAASSQPVSRSAQSTEASASISASNDTIAAVHELANKVNQLAMKTAAPVSNSNNAAGSAPAGATTQNSASGEPRPARGSGTGGLAPRGRGFRGSFREQQRKVEVPATDYDFASANAKFNKQDLVKEVTAGGEDERIPHPESPANGTNGNADGNNDDDVVIPPAKFYNRGSSFFDNISCENKERAEAKEGEKPRGGAVWRGEEQKKNLETFGQGSVDGGFNHYGRSWRGRGRGRGYGRGRGGYGGSYGRGIYNRGASQGQQQHGGAVAGGDN